MPITVRAIDITRLAKRMLTAADMRRVGQTYIRIAQERIQAGIGSDGDTMKTPSKTPNAEGTYSQAYSDIRQFGTTAKQQKRNRKKAARGEEVGRTVAIRNLTVRGNMLRARRVLEITDRSVLVGWPSGIEHDKAEGNEEMSPFVRPTPAERNDLRSMIQQYIDKNTAAEQARARAEKG